LALLLHGLLCVLPPCALLELQVASTLLMQSWAEEDLPLLSDIHALPTLLHLCDTEGDPHATAPPPPPTAGAGTLPSHPLLVHIRAAVMQGLLAPADVAGLAESLAAASRVPPPAHSPGLASTGSALLRYVVRATHAAQAGRNLLPTAHCPLPAAHCPLPARPLPAARCPLPAARCPLPAARCPLPAARCPLPAARCPLPAARCPLALYHLAQPRLICELPVACAPVQRFLTPTPNPHLHSFLRRYLQVIDNLPSSLGGQHPQHPSRPTVRVQLSHIAEVASTGGAVGLLPSIACVQVMRQTALNLVGVITSVAATAAASPTAAPVTAATSMAIAGTRAGVASGAAAGSGCASPATPEAHTPAASSVVPPPALPPCPPERADTLLLRSIMGTAMVAVRSAVVRLQLSGDAPDRPGMHPRR
jgi:hypothetical protein